VRLIDVLETKNLLAQRAALMRDYKSAMSRLEKVAMEKTAGPALDKVMGLLTRPFKSSPMEQLIASAKNRELGMLKSLIDLIPNDPADIRAELGKAMQPGAKNPIMQRFEDLQRARQGLEKSDSKLPFKAVIGLIGADAAISGGLLFVDKKLLDSKHKENLEMIAGDPQIPASLRNRAKEMYGILARYAPSVARDPVFSKDFTKNLIRHDTVDHKIIEDLTSIEKTYRESKGQKAQFINGIRDLTLKSTGWF